MFNLSANDVVATPFPHAIKNQILPRETFAALQREFPEDRLFDENARHEWGGGRINLVRGNPIFEKFIRTSPAWGSFYDYVNSQIFVSSMVEIFGDHFERFGATPDKADWRFLDYVEPLEYSLSGGRSVLSTIAKRTRLRGLYNRLMRMLHSNSLYVTFDIARSRAGYRIPPHTDNRYKLIIGLIYFNDVRTIGGEGGMLLLHRHKHNLPMHQYPRYPKEEDLETVHSLTPNDNVGVFQMNCNNSYHSTTDLRLDNGFRRFLYISVAHPFVNSAWH